MDIEYLKTALIYDPESGVLTWRFRPRDHFNSEAQWRRWNAQNAGKKAGSPNSSGYVQIQITINGKCHRPVAHNVAWAVQTGSWPIHEIDHEDHRRDNNRWSNLREATKGQNMGNLGKRRNNRSGVTGVHQDQRGKWRAQIREDGRIRDLGSFPTKDEAVHARKAAEIALGYHANHGTDTASGEKPMFGNTITVDSDDLQR